MGLGDWIMATAQVRELNERTGQHVVVVDRMGRPRWSEVFDNNPRLVRTHRPGSARLLNAGGARPYIKQKTPTHWFWQRWDIQPGELFLTPSEIALGVPYAGCVLVEPNTKVVDGNKAWPFERWQELVRLLACDHVCVQVGAPGSRVLDGVQFVETLSVRHAFGVLAAARVFVGSEGALHHAAAALGVPAVVLWSEFISPLFTGYGSQHNIRKTSGVCGSRLPCVSCRASMEAIGVEEVYHAVQLGAGK